MERDPDIRREQADAGSEAWADNQTPGPAHLPLSPGSSVDDDDAKEDALALADVAAGRWHPHSLVSEWLMTWGAPDYLPFEEWLAARNG